MSNPLLSPGFAIPFESIRAEHVEPAIQQLLVDAHARLAAIVANNGARTFDNTMSALDLLTEPLDTAMHIVGHLEAVATTPELRAAYNAVQPAVSAFYTSIPLDEGLWRAIREYSETEEAKSLRGARRRFLEKTIADFKRHGAELDEAGKKRLEAIDIELTELTTRFSENVLDSTNAWDLVITDQERLKGLPESALAAARASAALKKVEGWRFTLQAPSYTAVMTYLDDAPIREQMYRAYVTRAIGGKHDNRALLARILEMRREKARLLGYANFADLVLEDRMAKRGGDALAFVEELDRKTRPHFERENGELLEFRRKLEGTDAPALQPWDVAYYAEKLRAALYDFDEEDLRPYFPLERVVAGMFEIAHKLYGIDVVERQGVPKWDPATQYYEILAENGEMLGAFYADWHPRENKRGGAWMDAFLTGGPREGVWTPHLGLICGNLTPPVDNKPALLTHREVETVFHEFGHLLHHCLSRVEVRTMAGTNVAWDFVELPSQIMENWCWERPALDLFARQWQTGETIPEELFQKMVRARTFRSANAQVRQLGFAYVDLYLHIRYDPLRDGDVMEVARQKLAQYSPAPLPAGHGMIASFTHLFANPVGYGAGYYSYKWAEVLDADAFSRFAREGIFSRETGEAFRDAVLARGDSEDPGDLYRAFMGRNPDPEALMRRSGLA